MEQSAVLPSGHGPCPLRDPAIPVWLTEGQWKALALYQLAHESRSESDETPVPVCIGVPGVWNWLGKIGIVTGPNGQREQQKGPVPDLSLLIWEGRRAYIIY